MPGKKMLVHVAWSVLFISGFQAAILPAAAQQAVVAAPENSSANSKPPLVAKAEESPVLSELPDSPGAVASRSMEPVQQQTASGATASAPQAAQSQPAPQSQPAAQKPVGTAAAEAPDASGIAASQPAGVAIAPAKQRRTRTIILRMGAIIGAGVAVGSVVALTSATSSKPPGAH
jgi:hypothetical protein